MDKKYIHLIMALLFCVTIFFSVWYYVENTRYCIAGVDRLRAYKIDRKTGHIWSVTPQGVRRIK
jgi:hypothetical protein